MGQLSKILEEFRDVSNEYYEKIREILEEEYCWKCPQRSTSNIISCKEVDAWIRLVIALEEGIKDSWVKEEYSTNHINAKFLEKISPKFNQRAVIMKLNENKEPYGKKGEYVVIQENFSNIKKDNLVLISQICPIAQYFYLKIDFIDFPFKIDKVKCVYHEKGVKYIELGDGSKISFYNIIGIITKVFSKKDPIFRELNLK